MLKVGTVRAPRGVKATELTKTKPSRLHGTTIYFEPDADIFRVNHFDAEWIKAHLEDMSYIHRGLAITFINEVTGEKHDLSHPGGIPEFLTQLVAEEKLIKANGLLEGSTIAAILLEQHWVSSNYRLRIGNGSERIEWIAAEDDGEVVHAAEPHTDWLLRFRLGLLSIFVSEDLL